MEAIACGILASLVWAGLVGLSPDAHIPPKQLGLKGCASFLVGNSLLWLSLTLLNLKLWWLWIICFSIANSLISYRLTTLIPPLWRMAIHPLLITGMIILLAGSLGAI